MSTECYPIAALHETTSLYRDYLAMAEPAGAAVRAWYGAEPLGKGWMRPAAFSGNAAELADALERQNVEFGAGAAAMANIARLRAGARAVVTGQQVGLLGGPLLTLLKAATAVARARQATEVSGVQHVPVFWLATEDHDIEEVDQVSLLGNCDAAKMGVETLRLGVKTRHGATPVGGVKLGDAAGAERDALLDRASELLSYAPVCALLRECYAAGQTFGGAFARLMARLFAEQGLIVMDAAGREFHALGARVLRGALEQAEELEEALLARTKELEAAGYHAQVLVKPGASLLFLVSEIEGAAGEKTQERQALRRPADGTWRAGAGANARTFTTAELLTILETAPERLSPNALLRPVFQDGILPTAAYIGGPSEVAYFAQSAVLYQRLLGRVTSVLPRLSATLIEPEIGAVMAAHEVSLPEAMQPAEELAQRLGARAIPIEGKRRLAAAGEAMDAAIQSAEDYLSALDAGLGRSAKVSGSKMRYQMNRLRRLAAGFQLQREASLRKHAEAITLHLHPEGHAQERVLAGVWFVAAWEAAHGEAEEADLGTAPGTGLIARLVEEAASYCPGHLVIRL